MTKAAVISARIDPELKKSTEQIFQELGLSTTQAITLFYKQVALQRGLPFLVKLPNEETQQALAEAKARYDLESFDDTETLFEELDV